MMRFFPFIYTQRPNKTIIINHIISVICLLMVTLLLVLSRSSHAAEESIFQSLSPETADLNQYQWQKRPIVIFATSPSDSSYRQQIMMLEKAKEGLADRDIIVLSDTSPSSRGKLRSQFQPSGFILVLIGKDGGAKLQEKRPVSAETLLSTIDRMPMRKANLD